MKPAKTLTNFSRPSSWHDMAMGGWIADRLQAELDECCEALFGYHLIKLGALSAELSCRASQIPHQINVGQVEHLAGVKADLGALPFQEASVDVCLLAHTLDYCHDPHQVLREVERVLTADGVIVLTGFNPFSYLGLRRFLPFYRKQLPWSGRMFTPQRVKDWLNLLGFEVIEHKQLAYFSLGSNAKKNHFLDDSYCRSLAFIYMLVAKKRRSRLTPIKNRWKLKRRISVPELEGITKVKR